MNPEGHLNCYICSKVTAILVNGGILHSRGVALGRTQLAQLDHLVAQMNHRLLKPPHVWCQVCIQTQGGFSWW